MRRRRFIGLVGAAAAWPLAARAQADRVRRIAMLSGFTESDPEAQARVAAFRQGLLELGWTEGRNVHIDFRWGTAEVAQMRTFAKELVGMKPDLILGVTTPAIAALLQETRTIPIVFVQVVDPLGRGFIASLARPGGNITGFLSIEFSMAGKWLQTLKQIAPGLTRAALLFNPSTAPFAGSFVKVAAAAAPSFAAEAVATPVRGEAQLEHAFAAFAAKPNGGLVVLPDVFTASHRDTIIALAARHRLPAVYPYRYFAASGGLISDGVDSVDPFRRSASYVDRILKGARPGDLPVQAPAKFELVVNLKTAKTLGIEIPPGLLARADEVIE